MKRRLGIAIALLCSTTHLASADGVVDGAASGISILGTIFVVLVVAAGLLLAIVLAIVTAAIARNRKARRGEHVPPARVHRE